MLNRDEAQEFAQEWIDAWNAHDVERVLSHYTEDFEMSSPFIMAFAGQACGTLKGHQAVGAYWRDALQRIPDLQFELIEVFTCVDSIVICYNSVLGKLGAEVLFINAQGKACKAFAHYDK